MNRPSWRLRSLTFVLVTAMLATVSGAFVGQECCISLFGRAFCGAEGQDTPPGAGGIGQPSPTPAPPPHQWVLLPGISGLYSAWYLPCGNPPFCEGDGNPDHHDFASTQHAVDIGAGQCEACPDVYYYDNSGSVSTYVNWFPNSCSGGRGGGERVEIRLTSVDPPGVLQGVVAYLHLENAVQSGSVTNGTRIGTVHRLAPPASTDASCWTGPHLHQGIDTAGSGAVISHYTGTYGSGANCEGYPYPQSTPYDPSVPNQQARTGVPCYALSW